MTGRRMTYMEFVCPTVTVTDWVDVLYPDDATPSWCTPGVIPVRVAGVVPCATPSRVTLAPDGVEVTEMVPVVGTATSVPATVAVCPAVTVTDRVSDW
jgi:hypothetical protein